jgi:subtilisin family serine protease
MKRLLLLVLFVAAVAYAAPRVTPELSAHLEEIPADEQVRILVSMEDRMPADELYALTDGLTRDQRRIVVERELSRVAERTQRDVLDYLNERAALGCASEVKSLWLVNVVSAYGDRETIEHVSALPGVAFVDWDEDVPLEQLKDVVDGPQDEIVWGVEKIRAPQVWNAGYDGDGIIVCVCDSGVNYNHVDLADHMWVNGSYPNHGRNFSGGDPNDTMDYDGHGTHVAGTVASDGTAGSQCGVAPEATIMIAKLGSWESCWFEAWQWAITNGADVITQSWSRKIPNNPAYALHREASEGILAAGVVHTNSIGNNGHETESGYPIPFNIAAPGNCPPPWLNPAQALKGGVAGTMGIGATDSNDYRAYYSGRGPSTWDKDRHFNIPPYDDYHYQPEMGLIKPDFMAPGSGVKSCNVGDINGYCTKSGTSMSTPHAAGAAALLLDYMDTLPPAQIEKALELTAERVPGQTKNKQDDFGAGRIDVRSALTHLQNSIGIDLEYFRAAGLDRCVRLSWSCEAGTYAGFNLYREAESGATDVGRVRVNSELITGGTPFVYEDANVESAAVYDYWLEAIPLDGKAELFGPASAQPGLKRAYGFALEPSYPNPADSEANIAFTLPLGVTGDYTVSVFDLSGRKIRTVAAGAAVAGRHEASWDLANEVGARVPPGVYLYWLNASCGSAARRMVVGR